MATAVLAGALGLLAACGGNEDASDPQRRPLAARSGVDAPTAAMDAPSISHDQLFGWAQREFATLFPAGATTQALSADGVDYAARYYPSTSNYLGVGSIDGRVYGYGPFTADLLQDFGSMNDFACDVLGTCTRVSPDSDGNLGAGWARVSDFTVRSGTSLRFEELGAADTVIEVGSPSLSSAQLCTATTLPAGTARAATLADPAAASPYLANQFSGPFRTYPAGLYSMSPLSDDCGYIERAGGCAAPNEVSVGTVIRGDGVSEALCAVSPSLMNPQAPTRPLLPLQANPACERGQVLDATWADDAVQGIFLRLSWNDLQPSAFGQYDWSHVDRAFAQAVRHGKQLTLGIRVGGNAIPEWVFASGHPTRGAAARIVLRDWGTGPDSLPDASCGHEYVVASPADLAYRAMFVKALDDLLAHVREDQRRYAMLAGVKVTGLAEHTLENRLPKRCNIAQRSATLGDTGTQGHIVDMDSSNLAAPVFESKYFNVADPQFGRVKDVSSCVCNPQVLAWHGYKPSTVLSFYEEVEAALRRGIGHKQMVFMNISDGFPRVGEAGRFEGDHLVGPIVAAARGADGLYAYTVGNPKATRARSPADIPDSNEVTRTLVESGRNGTFAPGASGAGRQFGVENAALQAVGFATQPGARCSQQLPIATTGPFVGSAAFPIASNATVDNVGVTCPNWMATKEGVAYDKVTGFQVAAGMGGAVEIDAALWNLTLNTNGLFFEYYERDNWLARKQSALVTGSAYDAAPAVRNEVATQNHSAATAKSGVDWNNLLRARAASFSADARHANAYQADPYPSSFVVNVAPAPGSVRYVFNARACRAWAERGVPVRVNRVTIVD